MTRPQVVQFLDAWSEFDPSGSYFMPTALVPKLVLMLEAPLGVAGSGELRSSAQLVRSIIQATAIPDHNGKVHFVEVRVEGRKEDGRGRAGHSPERPCAGRTVLTRVEND